MYYFQKLKKPLFFGLSSKVRITTLAPGLNINSLPNEYTIEQGTQ